jgi:hypothetical protein
VRHETAHHTLLPASRGLIQTDMGEQTFVSRARNLGTNNVDAVRQQAMFAALDRPKGQVIKLLTSTPFLFGEIRRKARSDRYPRT